MARTIASLANATVIYGVACRAGVSIAVSVHGPFILSKLKAAPRSTLRRWAAATAVSSSHARRDGSRRYSCRDRERERRIAPSLAARSLTLAARGGQFHQARP